MKNFSLLIAFFVVSHTVYLAQDIDSSSANHNEIIIDSSKASPSVITISGEAGFTGELYSISGRERRRPPSSGLIFLRPTLTFFDNFNMSFEVLLSTETNSLRQQINQLAIHPDWGWGKAHIGDFMQEFSPYTLNGINVRGAGLEFYPGILRLQLIGGQLQRAVNDGPYNSVYSRYLSGVKLGIGWGSGSFVDLNFLRIRDNTASLPHKNSDSSSILQSTIKPQENMVLGINTKISFLEMFSLKAEIAADAFSRDIYSSALDSVKMPSLLKSIYKPTISTSIDYAYNTEVTFNYDTYNAAMGFSVINPGYTSLGLNSFVNDRQNFTFGTGARFFNNKLTVQGNFQTEHDNLLSQKLYTLSRSNYNLLFNIVPLQQVTITLNTMVYLMENNAVSDTFKVDNISRNYTAAVSSRPQFLKLNHLIFFSYSTQSGKDNNRFREGNDVNVRNLTFNVTTTINPNWSVAPGFLFNTVDVKNAKNSTNVFSLKISNRYLNNKLNNAVTIGLTSSNYLRSTVLTWQSAFSFSLSDILNFTIRSSFNKSKSVLQNFNEHKANLTFTHRF